VPSGTRYVSLASLEGNQFAHRRCFGWQVATHVTWQTVTVAAFAGTQFAQRRCFGVRELELAGVRATHLPNEVAAHHGTHWVTGDTEMLILEQTQHNVRSHAPSLAQGGHNDSALFSFAV
jgi:hypothetical protein